MRVYEFPGKRVNLYKYFYSLDTTNKYLMDIFYNKIKELLKSEFKSKYSISIADERFVVTIRDSKFTFDEVSYKLNTIIQKSSGEV